MLHFCMPTHFKLMEIPCFFRGFCAQKIMYVACSYADKLLNRPISQRLFFIAPKISQGSSLSGFRQLDFEIRFLDAPPLSVPITAVNKYPIPKQKQSMLEFASCFHKKKKRVPIYIGSLKHHLKQGRNYYEKSSVVFGPVSRN